MGQQTRFRYLSYTHKSLHSDVSSGAGGLGFVLSLPLLPYIVRNEGSGETLSMQGSPEAFVLINAIFTQNSCVDPYINSQANAQEKQRK